MTHREFYKVCSSGPTDKTPLHIFLASNSNMNPRIALIVVDVQEGIANLNDGVPDAEKIVPAIDSILRLARSHNEMAISTSKSKDKIVELLFVQHDDKDPEDSLFRGKPTWNLVLPPRQGAKNERLIFKNVGVYEPWIY
jgi:hypothetical protein